jgi:hypothetical protein
MSIKSNKLELNKNIEIEHNSKWNVGEFVKFSNERHIFHGIIIQINTNSVIVVTPDHLRLDTIGEIWQTVKIQTNLLKKTNLSMSDKLLMLHSLGFDFLKGDDNNLLKRIKGQLIS